MKFIKKYSILFLSLTLFQGCQFPTFKYSNSKTKLTLNNSSNIYKEKISTISNIIDIEKFIDKNSLVIFDIDLTLVKEYLKKENGDCCSFESGLYSLIKKFLYKKSFEKNYTELLNRLSELGIYKTKSEIKEIFYKNLKPLVRSKIKTLWGILKPQIEYKLMEKNIPNIISNLQKAGNKVMCFTAREWSIKDATRKDLLKVNIDVATNNIYDKLLVKQPFKNKYGFGFENGVLSLIRNKNYTSRTQKGEVLLKFLKTIGYKPTNIVFTDNEMNNVKGVVKEMNNHNITTKGFWYKFSGYIENPILRDTDVKILNKYFGPNWWNIKLDINIIIKILFQNFNNISNNNSNNPSLLRN